MMRRDDSGTAFLCALDRVCRRYERWRNWGLRIEHVLWFAWSLPRRALLFELLICEIELQLAEGRVVSEQAFLRRFARDESTVRRAFGEAETWMLADLWSVDPDVAQPMTAW